MAEVLDDELSNYLSDAMIRPFEWGTFDCMLFIADWLHIKTGVDPGATYRGTYNDQREARRIMKEAGGITKMLDVQLEPTGYVQVGDPIARGDVGIVPVFYKQWRDRQVNVPMGAIYLGNRMWSVKPADPNTLIAREFRPMAVWSNG